MALSSSLEAASAAPILCFNIAFANTLISHCKSFCRAFSQVNVTVINIAIVDGHDYIATYSYGCFLDDHST